LLKSHEARYLVIAVLGVLVVVAALLLTLKREFWFQEHKG